MSRRRVAFGSTIALVACLAAAPLYAEEATSETSAWTYGGFVDLSYALNFNFPENHLWRSKETTTRTNELAPNILLAYIEKEPRIESRWGMELAFQAGYDTDALVPEEIPGRSSPIRGADVLRHVSRANVSYLAPVGNGLALTVGLMKGYINYESFYAKNNFNYTRAYLTDYNPNFVFGVGGRYGFTKNVDVGFHVMNGFNYLSHPNNLPSYGAELDWRISKRMILYENLYYGPDQSNTAVKFWRFFSDTTLEWTGGDVTVAGSYNIGTEKSAEQPSNPQTFWMGAAVFSRWNIGGPWSLAFRPEFYWDPNGRISNFEQLLWAITNTVEYRRHFGHHLAVLRLEYRYDRSTGPQGGFFKDGDVTPGVPRLAADQHLLVFSLNWAFDS